MPDDWEAHRTSGYGELHRLTHTPCGWTSSNSYDLVLEGVIFGRTQARQLVFSHDYNEN
jgi:hypothetical protein